MPSRVDNKGRNHRKVRNWLVMSKFEFFFFGRGGGGEFSFTVFSPSHILLYIFLFFVEKALKVHDILTDVSEAI